MTTLKEHQAAMVQLLANGSGIPASASRLAHAMHDVLEMLGLQPGDAAWRVTTYNQMQELFARTESLGGPWSDATTPGLNDKALSKPQKAMKTDSPSYRPTPAERRITELENTIRQLKANNAKLRADKCELEDQVEAYRRMAIPEQAGCRKPDTQVCEHDSWEDVAHGDKRCCDCGELFR